MARIDALPARGAEMVSLPFYAAGLVITLCGTFAANASLPLGDTDWLVRTTLITLLGFLFSYGCRCRKIPSRTVEIILFLFVAFAVASAQIGAFDYMQFLPTGSDNANLRLEALLAWAGTLWSWTLLTDNRVMLTAVFAMAAIGLAAILDLNNPVLICFGVFIVAVIFLLIHQNYLQTRARASALQQALPVAPMLLAQGLQTAVCALAVLIVGLIVIVPAQASFSRLSLGGAIRQLVNLGKGSNASLPGQILRYSDSENFAIGTGEGWSSSPDVLLHVAPSDGQEHLWRGRTYDHYTGDGWQSSMESAIEPLQGIANHATLYRVPLAFTPGDAEATQKNSIPPTFQTRVILHSISEEFFYPGSPRAIEFRARGRSPGAGGVELCHDGLLDLPQHEPFRNGYIIFSARTPDPAAPDDQVRLRQEGINYPPRIKHLYLEGFQNSITTDDDLEFYRQMLGEALANIPPERQEPFDEAMAIRDWVSQRCVYSLAVPPITPDSDHVHEFLGNTRRGYCDMFASSMAVLCRTEGIPARVCTGFAPGEPDSTGFNLRGEDKHAWVEVYFPHSGWVSFDPTAGSRSDGSVPGATAAPQLFHWQRFTVKQAMVPSIIIAAILLLLLYVFKTEILDRRVINRRPTSPRESEERVRLVHRTLLGKRYSQMTGMLGKLGLHRRASETPAEYASRALPFLESRSEMTGILLDVSLVTTLTSEFILACYSSEPFVNDAKHWQLPISEFINAVRRLQWRLFWKQLPQLLTRRSEFAARQ